MPTKLDTTSKRLVRAGVWTVGSRLGGKLIDLCMLFCLARFLGPQEFGLVAIGMAAVFVVEALFELPMIAALVRVEVITSEMLDTAFTLSLIRGVLIALILSISSIALAAFNKEPRLIELLIVLSFAPALRGLVSPKLVEYTRAFNFRPDAIMEITGKVIAFIVSVSIAMTTASYWAIAAATVCAPLVGTMLSYIIAPMRPSFTLKCWKQFSNLIGWNFVAQLCASLNWQSDRLILPQFTTTSSFGRYSMAKQLSEIPIQALVIPLNRPAMAAFAEVGGGKRRYLQLSQSVAILLVPVLTFCLIWPDAVVRICLGSKWLTAVDLLQLISASAILGIPGMLLAPLAMTLDRTKWLAFRTLAELTIRVPLTWLGAVNFGIFGAIGAGAIATCCGSFIAIIVSRKLVNTSLREQLLALWRPLLAVIPAAIVLLIAKNISANGSSYLFLFVTLIVFGFFYLFVYTSAIFILWKSTGSPAGIEKQFFDKLANLWLKIKFYQSNKE